MYVPSWFRELTIVAEYYDHWIRFSEDPEAFLADQGSDEAMTGVEEQGQAWAEDELALDASWYYRAMGQQ